MSLRTLKTRALRWRARLIPESRGLGWAPFLWLGYLAFPLLPLFAGWLHGTGIVLTLLSIPLFLLLYSLAYRLEGTALMATVLAIAALGFVLTPWNPFANAYLIYAA